MKKIFFCLIASLVAFASQAADPPVGQLPDGTFYIKDEVDFALKESVATGFSPVAAGRRAVNAAQLGGLHPAIREVVGAHAAAAKWLKGEALPPHLLKKSSEVPMIARSLKAKLRDGEDAATVLEALRKHPDVEWASLNILHKPTLVPSDARWGDQWGPQRVRADEGWDVSPASTTLRVAIVDTGVDLTHPDLASRIVYNNGFGGNANGDCMRDRRGGNSIDHGTHCAGIAAAIRNTVGIAGIARANIMAMGCASWMPAPDNQYGIGWAADAINDAVANNADVINCSFGNSSLSASESNALNSAESSGIVVCCAAGNDSMNVDSSPSAGWNDHSWPLIVSNTTTNDTLRASSNFGSAIDLAAPGTDILSTVSTNYHAYSASGQYEYFTGTSMASPTVAGAVAMVKSMNPSRITGSGLKHFLYRTAEDLGTAGKDTSYGNGMLQLDPVYLQILKDADFFLNPSGNGFPFAFGTYTAPFDNLADAVTFVPAGGTIVLNGGTVDYSTYHYPAPITITNACRLTAFPDHPAVLGN